MRFFIPLLLCAAAILGARAQAPGDTDGSCTETTRPNNWEVLMDSRNYPVLLDSLSLIGDPVWTSFDADGDSSSWIHSLGGVCQQQLRACDFQNGDQENWLITQHISKFTPDTPITYPVTIHIDVSWRFIGCTSGGCSNPVEVYKYLADDPVDEQDYTDTSKYSLLGTITPSTNVANPRGTSSFQFDIQPGEEGFYLAIVDKGVCVQLSRLVVYRLRCAGRQDGLAIYPSTATPKLDQEDAQVTATCVQNASPVGNVGLSCSAEGEWAGSPSCDCNLGFIQGEDQDTRLAQCEACQAGFYRSASDVACMPCPDNTVTTGVGVGQCACLDGYFRAGDDASEACQPPPSGDIFLGVSSTTASTITLTWSRPSVTGNNVFYKIELSNPENVFGDFIVIESHYTDDRDQLTYTIEGLQAFTQYQVRVSVHNDVSDQDQENELQRVQEEVATTDAAPPEPPSSVQGLCTFVLWNEPRTQNCELTGYEIEFKREDSNQVALVTKEASDRFHEIDSSTLPTGNDKLSFRIRALCSAFTGEWSEEILVCEEDDGKSGVPCEECPECEDPTPVTTPTAPARITNVIALADGVVVWTPPTGEVTKYTVRVFYHNRRGTSTGVQTDIVGAQQAWLKLSESFTFVQGVQYFFQVRAVNSGGSGLYSTAIPIIP